MRTEKNIAFQKSKIFYRVIGEGPAVMLLHGLPFDGNLWKQQLDSLSRFKVVIPDLPGSGASEMIDDMSMEGMAEVIKTILDSEQIPFVILIGHSMGGYISLAFAEKYSQRLKGMGLFHSTAFPDTEERMAGRRKGIDFIEKNGAHEFLKTIIPNLFSPQSRDNLASSIDELVEKTNNFSSHSLVSYYKAMMQRPDRSNVLKLLKVPMLFIAGKYDTAAPLNELLELCHLPEISYFHILTESGHLGMLEETEKSNIILNDYLIKLS
jgi:pimeloyl-ACP methyl ester carboxylesterase